MTGGRSGAGEPRADGHGPRAERRIALLLAASTVAALALAGLYLTGAAGSRAEGALLGTSLAGIGAAAALWARHLTPPAGAGEDDPPAGPVLAAAGPDDRGRRSVLRLFWAAGGALALAGSFPVRALAPPPGPALRTTSWRAGARLVDLEGRPVRVDSLQPGGALTAFPQGARLAADSQVVVIRLDDGEAAVRRGRETWSARGYVAYSVLCTHAGCPVGPYQPERRELVCPCHRSTFDAADGARPVAGPANRSLPQLPLAVDAQGYLVAQSDFDEPVGPGFWNRG